MAEDPLARARAHAPAQAPAPSEAVPAGAVPPAQPAGPRALLWLASAAEAGVHVQLAWAIAMIAAPRLARRGVIPPELANALAFAPVFMAAGSTPGSDRANGNGEVNASGVATPESPVQ